MVALERGEARQQHVFLDEDLRGDEAGEQRMLMGSDAHWIVREARLRSGRRLCRYITGMAAGKAC